MHIDTEGVVGSRGLQDWTATRCAAVHQHHVYGQPIEPSRKPRLASEIFDAAVDLQEYVLHQVFEFALSTRHAQHEACDIGAMIPKHLAERQAVTGFAAFYQVGEVGHGA